MLYSYEDERRTVWSVQRTDGKGRKAEEDRLRNSTNPSQKALQQTIFSCPVLVIEGRHPE